jgi:hypothetical protein
MTGATGFLITDRHPHADHLKLHNIRRDPRVALSVESDVPSKGSAPSW